MSALPDRLSFSVPPLAFTREEALAFTRWSSSLLDTLERKKAVTPKRFGSRGEKVYYRPQLEQVAASLFASGSGIDDADDDFA